MLPMSQFGYVALAISLLACAPAQAATEELPVNKKTVAAWLEQLKNGKSDEREQAASMLAEIPRYGDPRPTPEINDKIVTALTASLKDPDEKVRESAARTLPSYESAAKPAVGGLIELLAEENKEIVDQAWSSLAELGPHAFPELLAALKNKNPKIRAGAAQSFAQMSISQPHKGLVVRQHAKEILPALLDVIENDSELIVQGNAMFALQTLGPAAADAVPVLTKLLSHKEWEICRAAVEQLRIIGPAAKPAVPQIIEAMKRGKEKLPLYGACAAALAELGMDENEATRAVPVLIEALQNKRLRGSSHFAEALVKAGKAAVPALLEQARSDDEQLRTYVIFTLGMIGPNAKSAQADLLKMLKDPGPYTRRAATAALISIAADDAEVSALTKKAIEGQNPDLAQFEAFDALGFGGPAARTIVLEYLKSENAKIRALAVGSLSRMSWAVKENVPVLIDALKDSSKEVRESAAHALGEFRLAARDALPALKAVSAAEKKDRYRTSITDEAIEKISDALLEVEGR